MKKTTLRWKGVLTFLLLLALLWKMEASAASGINVEYHTQEEIKQKYQELNIQPSLKTGYQVNPSLEVPYAVGVLDDATVNNAMSTLNFVRYVAGISYNVQNDVEHQEMAQAAALINSINGGLSHYPEQPANMSEELYHLGYSGAGSSNLGVGYGNLYSAIVSGWMNDGSESNIDRVGHRRWCLNPTMGKTAFGVVGSYYAMYSFDRTNASDAYGVVWPAQNTPMELFSNTSLPWNISMGKDVDISSVQVSMKRQRDDKQWSFSQASSQGYFNVNNSGYGMSGCIIFRPDDIEEYQENDSFHVEVQGTYLSGEAFEVSYDVNFFWIEKPVEEEEVEEEPVEEEEPVPVRLSKPKGLKLKRLSSGRVKIKWKKVPGATKYKVYCKKGKKGKYKKIGTTSRTSLVQKKCKKGRKYRYKVRAFQKTSSATIKSGYSAVKKLKY
ncbi:MAG: CAP domain-containing protein [Eubacteriales bacterium]|nr:CAP domain-containing protein [Eubacteriales bacterium]